MKASRRLVVPAAWGMFVLLAVPMLVVGGAAQQVSDHSEFEAQTVASARQQAVDPVVQLPDSPGATLAELQPPPQTQTATPQASAPAASQPQPAQPQNETQTTQKPVGTAAAEPLHASGIAASQPAGVAVAPQKQKRTRTLVIKVGAIIAAGAAVGAIVALSAGTSSRPPGAH
jgi:hypothetical protein